MGKTRDLFKKIRDIKGTFQAKMCKVVRIGKKSPKWRWLKDLEGKARENRTKEGPRTGVRTSAKTMLCLSPIYIRQTQGQKRIKRGAKALFSPFLLPPSPPERWGDHLFASLDQRALMPQRWIFLLLSKIEL